MHKDLLIKNKNGLSLVELILAMGLFAMLAVGIITFVTGAYSANLQSEKLTRATAYLQETQEALRAISKEAWNYMEPGTYGLTESSGKWELAASPDTIDDTFARTITISEGDPTTDQYLREISTDLAWSLGDDRQLNATATSYLNNWDSEDWTQTDWSGGSGQLIYSVSDRYRNDTRMDTSVAGELTLATKGSGNYYRRGTLTSSFYGPYSNYNILSWTETIPGGCPECIVRVKIRTAPDAGGSPGSFTSWSSVHVDSEGILIPQTHLNNEWIQYRIILRGTKTQTPVLEDITINYYE